MTVDTDAEEASRKFRIRVREWERKYKLEQQRIESEQWIESKRGMEPEQEAQLMEEVVREDEKREVKRDKPKVDTVG